MANYYQPQKYSLLNELPSTQYGATQYPKRLQEPQMIEGYSGQEPFMSPETRQATAAGMQSGGLSGALISGGVTSGNPWAIGGGVLLSELEAKKNAEIQREQEEIANEKDRRSKMQGILSQMGRTNFGV